MPLFSSRSAESVALACALALSEATITRAETPAQQSGPPPVMTRFDSESARAMELPAEIQYVLAGLDHDNPRIRSDTQKYLNTHAERLVPELNIAAGLGRGSNEVLHQIEAAANAHDIKLDRPERLTLEGVEWAVNNIRTPSGGVQRAVYAILHDNPLLYARSAYLDKLAANLDGENLILSVEVLAKKRPVEFIAALEGIADADLNVLFRSERGREILVTAISGAFQVYLKDAGKLSQANQVKLLGSSQSTIDEFVRAKLAAGADLTEVHALVARAGRINGCLTRLSSVGIDHSVAGMPLLEAAAEENSARLKIVETILEGVSRHCSPAAKAPATGPQELIMTSRSIDNSRYTNAAALWRLALYEKEYSAWLAPAGVDVPAILGDAIKDPRMLSNEEFLVRCWEAAVIVGLSPGSERPADWAVKTLVAVHDNFKINPPTSTDEWKLDELGAWIKVAGSVEPLGLPPELRPTALVQRSLPPNHVGGQGSAFGSLEEYIRLVTGTTAAGPLCRQSLDVLKSGLDKLSEHASPWNHRHTAGAQALIWLIETERAKLAAGALSNEQIDARLDRMRDEGIAQLFAPQAAADEPAAAPQNGKLDEHPTIKSLEHAIEAIQRLIDQ